MTRTELLGATELRTLACDSVVFIFALPQLESDYGEDYDPSQSGMAEGSRWFSRSR